MTVVAIIQYLLIWGIIGAVLFSLFVVFVFEAASFTLPGTKMAC